MKIDFKKYSPKNIIKKVSDNKKKFFFSVSMFFLCLSLIFTVLLGLLERDGVLRGNSPDISASATTSPRPTSSIKDTEYYISVNIGGEPIYLNSITAEDPVTKTVLRHMLECLVRYDMSGNIIAAAASEWTSDETKSVWTFKLRENALWQDNTKVVSGDFKDAIDLHLDESNGSPYRTQMQTLFKSVDCPDDSTIVFTLNSPVENFPEIVADTQFAPIQKELYEKNKYSYGKEPDNICYNGPWYAVLWTHGQRLVLSKNEVYWNKANIALQQIMLISSGSSDSKLMNFELGNYDMVYLSADEVSKYSEAGHKVENYYDGNTVYIDMNTSDNYLQSADLRKALSLGINREEFISKNLKTGASIVPGYNFEEDIITAKTLLESFKAASSIESIEGLTIMVDDSASSIMFASALSSQWKENLGIDISVEPITYLERIELIKKGTWHITINSTSSSQEVPEAPLYYRHTAYATNGRIKNVITTAGRDLDLYYATP